MMRRYTKRYKLVLLAIVVYMINIPLAWALLFLGHGLAAVVVVNIGTAIIYWVVWMLL